MGDDRFRLMIWLAVAFAIVSVGVASNASARVVPQDLGGPTTASPAPVVTATGGFDWGDALVGAGTALGAGLGGLGFGYLIRHRARLVT